MYSHTLWSLRVSLAKFYYLENFLTTFRVSIQVKVILTSYYISNLQFVVNREINFSLGKVFSSETAELDIEKEI